MVINIAYSCNDAYVMHTGISMISLFDNNKDIENINVYMFSKEISEKSLLQLKKIADDYGRNFIVIPLSSFMDDLHVKETNRHIITVYAKLFFSRLKDLNKIIYLDSDTIIYSSLKEMWTIDLGENYFAGVETFSVNSKNELGLMKDDIFINDGVVLMNLAKLRLNQMDAKFLEFIEGFGGAPPVLSEGTINRVCKGFIKSIHPKFNLMSGFFLIHKRTFHNTDKLGSYYSDQIISEAIQNPVIIHYLSAFFNRPWDRNCSHPLRKVYLKYKSMSPWKDVPLTDKKLSFRLRLTGQLINYFPDFIIILFIKLKNKISPNA